MKPRPETQRGLGVKIFAALTAGAVVTAGVAHGLHHHRHAPEIYGGHYGGPPRLFQARRGYAEGRGDTRLRGGDEPRGGRYAKRKIKRRYERRRTDIRRFSATARHTGRTDRRRILPEPARRPALPLLRPHRQRRTAHPGRQVHRNAAGPVLFPAAPSEGIQHHLVHQGAPATVCGVQRRHGSPTGW